MFAAAFTIFPIIFSSPFTYYYTVFDYFCKKKIKKIIKLILTLLINYVIINT
nr:MAG TPA: hypothetical protein [Caudoviricetes sp.]